MTTFTFSSPLARANYDNLVSVSPALDNLNVEPAEDGLSLTVFGDFIPDSNYVMKWHDDVNMPPDLWLDFPITGTQIGDRKRALILQSQLPASSTGNAFFMLAKPQ